MTERESKYKEKLDALYPRLVIGCLSDHTFSEGLRLTAERSIPNSKGIPLIDYYQEVECELSGGYCTGDLYDNGISYEFMAWIDKHRELHYEWENPAVLNIYVVDE